MARVSGRRIRDIRVRAGLTQEEVARKADMSLRQYSDYENKRNMNPKLSTLSAIAFALGVGVAELLDE